MAGSSERRASRRRCYMRAPWNHSLAPVCPVSSKSSSHGLPCVAVDSAGHSAFRRKLIRNAPPGLFQSSPDGHPLKNLVALNSLCCRGTLPRRSPIWPRAHPQSPAWTFAIPMPTPSKSANVLPDPCPRRWCLSRGRWRRRDPRHRSPWSSELSHSPSRRCRPSSHGSSPSISLWTAVFRSWCRSHLRSCSRLSLRRISSRTPSRVWPSDSTSKSCKWRWSFCSAAIG
jgi:hypothetical protein